VALKPASTAGEFDPPQVLLHLQSFPLTVSDVEESGKARNQHTSQGHGREDEERYSEQIHLEPP
jgi:hypothetical protein